MCFLIWYVTGSLLSVTWFFFQYLCFYLFLWLCLYLGLTFSLPSLLCSSWRFLRYSFHSNASGNDSHFRAAVFFALLSFRVPALFLKYRVVFGPVSPYLITLLTYLFYYKAYTIRSLFLMLTIRSLFLDKLPSDYYHKTMSLRIS